MRISSVNQAVHVVSMTKNGSAKLGASSATQCDVAKTGSVSTQNKTMEINVMATEM